MIRSNKSIFMFVNYPISNNHLEMSSCVKGCRVGVNNKKRIMSLAGMETFT